MMNEARVNTYVCARRHFHKLSIGSWATQLFPDLIVQSLRLNNFCQIIFTGPSFALDTACSSSIIAMTRAVEAVKNGECEAAIVAGAHLALKPASTMAFLRLGMLAPGGSCKAFDISGTLSLRQSKSPWQRLNIIKETKTSHKFYCIIIRVTAVSVVIPLSDDYYENHSTC